MTQTRELTDVVPDLVPVDVLTEVNTAIAVLEIQGPAITEALRQLDRATTIAWKAAKMHGVTDEEWELVKRAIGIDRGWEAANQMFSTLDLPGLQPSIDITPEEPVGAPSDCQGGRERPRSPPTPGAFACLLVTAAG